MTADRLNFNSEGTVTRPLQGTKDIHAASAKKPVLLSSKESTIISEPQSSHPTDRTNAFASLQKESRLSVAQQESAKPPQDSEGLLLQPTLQTGALTAPTGPAAPLTGLLLWVPPSKPSGKSSSCLSGPDRRLWLDSDRFQKHLRWRKTHIKKSCAAFGAA